MKIVIKTKDIELTQTLSEWIEGEFNSLEKLWKDFREDLYYEEFFGKGKPRIEAWVEIGRETMHHQKGPVFFAECQMRFPKKDIRAKTFEENLGRAVNHTREEIERQIREYKGKIHESKTRNKKASKKNL